MNQGKLGVVKQEMTRVNIDILGISGIRWTRMDEFNSDDHYIYYCGQESLRRNGDSDTENGLVDTTEKNRGKKIEWKRLEISSRKLKIPKENFMQIWAR